MPLKAPAFVVDSFEKKMEDDENECNKNVRQFKARLRLTDPNEADPGLVAHYYKKLIEDVAKVTGADTEL